MCWGSRVLRAGSFVGAALVGKFGSGLPKAPVLGVEPDGLEHVHALPLDINHGVEPPCVLSTKADWLPRGKLGLSSDVS